ncbi:MAG: TonB-dependent receptor [Bacteroidetes bacterium]|nr:TonB-dependent receptor [Bacteroidota bacterium]
MTQKAIVCATILIITTWQMQLFAQEKDTKKIETEIVQVEKSYEPALREAVRIRQQARMDSLTSSKIPIQYHFKTFAVASTFIPAKAKPSPPPRAAREKLFSHYAAFGAGSFANVEADFYGSWELNRSQSMSYYLNHKSSQGGISGIRLDDDYYDTQLGADFLSESQDQTYAGFVKLQHQNYNWYGLPNVGFSPETLSGIDESQTYFGINLGGEVTFERARVHNIYASYQGFFDDFSSAEHQLTASTNFDLRVSDYNLKWLLDIDLVNGSFDQNFDGSSDLSYNTLNIGIWPSYRYDKNDFTADIGIGLVGSFDTENSDTNVNIYPNIDWTYRPAGDLFWAFGGFKGKLTQNTYYNFAQNNFFVSPTLTVRPTDTNFDIHAGVSGKFVSFLRYELKVSYADQTNYAFYKLNPLQSTNPTEGYQFGNSFQVVYDDLETLKLSGSLHADFQKTSLSLLAEVFDYSQDSEAEPWNLPEVKITFTGQYALNKQWKLGADIFFVGERMDAFTTTDPNFLNAVPVNLDSYLDINLRGDYKYDSRWSFFGRINNLTGQDYERFANFEVQGIQFMAGASYRFDL